MVMVFCRSATKMWCVWSAHRIFFVAILEAVDSEAMSGAMHMDLTAGLSMFCIFFVTMLFIQILRFAACKRTFDVYNPWRGIFSFGFSNKCDKGFSITLMIVCCCCATWIIFLMTQAYNNQILAGSTAMPRWE